MVIARGYRSYAAGSRQHVLLTMPNDGLVSWGGDGTINFWSLKNRPRIEKVKRAHSGAVRNVYVHNDRLVSWGDDGAIRFWSHKGEELSDGILAAHEKGDHGTSMSGIRLLKDSLISWDEHGTIKFWSLAGAPRLRGVSATHVGGVKTVNKYANFIVSTDKIGSVRLWDCDGNPKCSNWIAPAELEGCFVLDQKLWVGLMGRPFRLTLEGHP